VSRITAHNSKTVLLNGEDHDVFGDGFLKLANTGNVLLSGDLYHYPEEITYKKVPNFDTNGEQTAKTIRASGARSLRAIAAELN
jgi:hypothetical protein